MSQKSCSPFPVAPKAARFCRSSRIRALIATVCLLGTNGPLSAQEASKFTYITNRNTLTITGYTGTDRVVTIPTTINGFPVLSIGDWAFYNRALVQIIIPDSVTSIGEGAFAACSDLTQVSIPKDVTIIGDVAFSMCSALTQVTMPSGLTSIGNEAFRECKNLTEITIPEGVTAIGFGAFWQCTSLTAIHVARLNSEFSSVEGVLLNTRHAELLQYPWGRIGSYSVPLDIKAIGNSAFYGCTGLTHIVMPNSVRAIGDYAFGYCEGLTQITIPESVSSIGRSAFSGCTGLTHVTIPKNVTSIGTWCFSLCTNLIRATLAGSSITSINDSAFYGCPSLNEVTMPDSVTSIGRQAFIGCTALTQVTIPSGVTSIDYYAFYGCTNLVQLKCMGNAPAEQGCFGSDDDVWKGPLVMYLPGTSGWGSEFSFARTTLWLPTLGSPIATEQTTVQVGIPLEWAPFRQVTIEACRDLAHPDWQPVGILTLNAAGAAQFNDTDSANHSARLYRLRTP